MPEDKGSQIVTIIHYAAASSPNVNRRHQDIRQTGIYQGGRLTVTDGLTKASSLSALVCEVSDGTHQVKVETTAAVSLTVAIATPYVVLRWTYAGASSDYMEVLAVATPSTNDLVVGKCSFAGGGDLQGFDYGDVNYPRSTPNTQDLFLKVEPTEDTELKVSIRAGRVQNSTETKTVPDQKSNVFIVPAANSKVYLLYITADGVISIDSSGTEAVSPTAPTYDGKIVLAEITLASTDTNITMAKIKDVRNFVVPALRVERYLATYNESTQQIANGAYTKVNLGTIKNQSNMNVSNNQITLAANRKYALEYSFQGSNAPGSTGDPSVRGKWVVFSGDATWNLEEISHISWEVPNDAGNNAVQQHSRTCYIIPSSETVIELQVYTENTTSKAQVGIVSVNIMSID